jgi:hypothetical protein
MRKLWLREYPLPKAFWVFGVLGYIVGDYAPAAELPALKPMTR